MGFWTAGALALGLVVASSTAQAVEVGKPAGDFTITTFDKQKVKLSDLKGKVVVINYWATWCTPCRAEMIAFDSYLRHHPQSDLKVFSIATENSVPADKLQHLADALSFPLARQLAGRGYGVMRGVPTSYVIDREGIVRHAEAGAFDEHSFEELVTPLLAAPARPAP